MNQRSPSLWHQTPPAVAPLRGTLEADVVIIGAGISGITAAFLLAERGRKVLVLERGTAGGAVTASTTAHITTAIDAGYHFLRRSYGLEEARVAADASRTALEMIAGLVERLGISCHFRRVPAWAYTEKRRYVAELKNEAGSAQAAGLDAQWVESVPLPFDTRGAILWPGQAQFHPGEYLAGLAARAVAAGVRIFDATSVVSIEEGEPCVVTTAEGSVRAGAVVQTTGIPLAGFASIQPKLAAFRTCAIAVQVDSPPVEGIFRDTADPPHFTHCEETGEGTFLIVGGEEQRVGEENDDPEAAFERLAAYSRQSYGEHPVRYRWTAEIIKPQGGLPLIGGSGKVYIATGYSGQETTFGTAGAILLTDLITGAPNRWKELFDPSRG